MKRIVQRWALLTAMAPFSYLSSAENTVDIIWQEACPVGASESTRCAELIVPERRDQTSQRNIRVPFAVIPAPDQEQKHKDPLLFLMGGTGNGFSVLHQVAILPQLLNRDVIVVEQRGNPMATPYYGCESVPPAVPLHRLYNSSVHYDGKASVEKCKQDLLQKGIDLQAYTTPFAADDLVDLRRALGIESWNVYGVSYGGRVGTTLMRKDPEAIRSLTIDSAQLTGIWFSAWERLQAVDMFFRRCAAAANCGTQFPRLRRTFEETLSQLAEEPIAINYAGQRDELNDYGYMHLVVWSLYQLGLNEMSRLPAAMEAAGRGDFNALLANNDIFGDYKPTRTLPNVGYTEELVHNAQQVLMLCAEEFPFNQDLDEPALARAAGWSPAVVELLESTERREREVCADWGFEADDPLQAEPPTGDRPTLIVYAEHDTIAPPSHGAIAAKSLDNAQLVVFPWTAHGVIYERQDCFFPMFIQFLANPEADVDTTCALEIDEPVWSPLAAQPGGDNPLGMLRAELANDLERFGFPGRAAWIDAPRISVSGAIAVGRADASGVVPLSGSEVFRIASQTKVFTAAAILRLVEQGRLDIDMPLSNLVDGDFEAVLRKGGYVVEEVTVRQLLDHTAGLPDWIGAYRYPDGPVQPI
ncbi:MAG: alpha/beta fold hydrolase [Pseudomonadota bacterium]